jgi:hypothetical protein
MTDDAKSDVDALFDVLGRRGRAILNSPYVEEALGEIMSDQHPGGVPERMTDAELERVAQDLNGCVDYEDYENVAFHYVHQWGGDTSTPEFEFPKLLINDLRATRAENAELIERIHDLEFVFSEAENCLHDLASKGHITDVSLRWLQSAIRDALTEQEDAS